MMQEVEGFFYFKEAEFGSVPRKFWVADAHKHMPAASSNIKVVHDKKTGRHVVAAQRIHAGDVVFVERPIVSTVCDEHYENICLG